MWNGGSTSIFVPNSCLLIENVITIFIFYIADVVAVTEAEAGGLGRSGAGDISTEVRSFRSNRTLIR